MLLPSYKLWAGGQRRCCSLRSELRFDRSAGGRGGRTTTNGRQEDRMSCQVAEQSSVKVQATQLTCVLQMTSATFEIKRKKERPYLCGSELAPETMLRGRLGGSFRRVDEWPFVLRRTADCWVDFVRLFDINRAAIAVAIPAPTTKIPAIIPIFLPLLSFLLGVGNSLPVSLG